MGIEGKVFEAKIGAAADVKTRIGIRLRELRQLAGITQAELATRLKIDQTAISRLERRDDIRLSTLRGYIEGLGAQLRIDATFRDHSTLIRHLEEAHYEYDYKDDDQLVLPILGDERLSTARDIVFSVKPEHSQKIEQRLKTVELRRRFPSSVPPRTVALIYSTTPIQALTGIAEIATVLKYPPDRIWDEFAPETCISKEDFNSYFAGTEAGFVIKLRNARPLRRVLYLDELRQRFNFEPPQSFLYAPPQLREALSYECSEIPH
jgi:predicted transcriptional regulator/DNA-binding XRE family transcriptional regulator